MKLKHQGKLFTKLPFVASRGLKSLHEGPGGLAAASIDDMMEQTGPNDPDSVGCHTNEPVTPWDQGNDDNPDIEFGRPQEDASQMGSNSISSPGGYPGIKYNEKDN